MPVIAAAGEAVNNSTPLLLQVGVFVTAIGAAVAGVIGALASARSKRAAADSAADAAKSATSHEKVEERIVGKDEFAEVIDGLRTIVTTQGEQIRGLEGRLTAKEGEVRGLRREVQECHDEKVQMRADFAAVLGRLRHQVTDMGGVPDD